MLKRTDQLAAPKKTKSTNIFKVEHRISSEDRWSRNGHLSGVLWFTGLSGSGKTTLSLAMERKLHLNEFQTYVLDGDNLRGGLTADLAFSPEDRAENIRRAGEVAALFADAGQIVLTAFISPYRADRGLARGMHPHFHEIFIKSDLETCERRDPKGLYKKARAGEIPDFTGISAPYEEPENPELEIDTAALDVDESVEVLYDYITRNFAHGGSAKDVA
ncbi:MAG: adenylyl-sulfate kinase [Rhodospirillales bacterium]|jgi:bifunctional enzyme CysN/CysC|nr:adenylyl-sulfate kinase [Rhodospirillales bacterium]